MITATNTMIYTHVVYGQQRIVLNWRNPGSVPLPVPIPSILTITPTLSSRLQVNSTGHLVSTGQLQASDAGTYNIISSGFSGELEVTLVVSGKSCLLSYYQ